MERARVRAPGGCPAPQAEDGHGEQGARVQDSCPEALHVPPGSQGSPAAWGRRWLPRLCFLAPPPTSSDKSVRMLTSPFILGAVAWAVFTPRRPPAHTLAPGPVGQEAGEGRGPSCRRSVNNPVDARVSACVSVCEVCLRVSVSVSVVLNALAYLLYLNPYGVGQDVPEPSTVASTNMCGSACVCFVCSVYTWVGLTLCVAHVTAVCEPVPTCLRGKTCVCSP